MEPSSVYVERPSEIVTARACSTCGAANSRDATRLRSRSATTQAFAGVVSGKMTRTPRRRSGRRVHLADALRHLFHEAAQDDVAHRMAPPVVDLLEVVDVEHDEREGLSAALGGRTRGRASPGSTGG